MIKSKPNLQSILNYNKKSLTVILRRGGFTESIHKVHAVICDSKDRVLIYSGDPIYQTFIRSALKPFQVLPFISSGAYQVNNTGEKGLAIASGSHIGSTKHAREAFKILWNSEVDISSLKCPTPTNNFSPLQHNCSGKHAAFLSTCKKMNWTLGNYLKEDHPIQIEIRRRISEILEVPEDELIVSKDDCGAPTLLLQLKQMATLYANLSFSNNSDLEQIRRSMIKYPELISGDGCFDTELMKRSHGQLISKGGSEGIQCIAKVGDGLGLAIKVEDGSKRAKHAAAIHLLNQLEWLTPIALQELKESTIHLRPNVELSVNGELEFQESINSP